MEILNLFPTPVYKDIIAIPESVDQHYQKERYARNNYNNGWMSKFNLHKDEKYKPLISIIDEHVNKFCYDGLKIKKNLKTSCCGAWINLHKGNDWAQEHRHTNSMISGVVYLSAPPSSGSITFHSDKQQTHMFGSFFDPTSYMEENQKLYQPTKTIDVTTGMILLFPSTLLHSVSMNINKSIVRSSFSFDYMLVGTLSTFLNEIHVSVS